MKYTQVPADTFEKLQLNAGVILNSFDPSTATMDRSNIIGATSGGVNFTATPTFIDFGEDIDDVPNNTKQLKRIDYYEAKLSGTMVTADTAIAKMLVAAADVSGNKVTPRMDLKVEDFKSIWWVGDYSDENGNTNGGFIAIELINALSNGGFQIQSGKKAKGTLSFEYLAHYDLDNPDTVPFNIYIKAGTTE